MGTEAEEDHHPTTEDDGLGLLRMEEKLWLLTSEIDFENEDAEVELDCFLLELPAENSADLPGDWEGDESIPDKDLRILCTRHAKETNWVLEAKPGDPSWGLR